MHPLIQNLLSHGHEFSFSQVMRLARRHLSARGAEELPEVPRQDRVKVRPELSLAFPAADVARVERSGEYGEDLRVTITFLGLYGASSPLPTHYTEDLMEEAAAESSFSRDFLDILHQRLYQLYFQCWSKYQLFIQVAEEKNPQDLERLFCLIGLGEKELRDNVPDAMQLLRYAGLLNQSPRSALGLRTLLRDALGVPKLGVEQCVPRQVPIPGDQRIRVGVANISLGVNTVVGSEIADSMGKFRLHIGPLSKEDFDTFLPGTPRHGRLASLIRLYIVDPFDYDLKLTLAPKEARQIRLGDPAGPRLGWNSWCFAGDAPGEVSAIFPITPSAPQVPSSSGDNFGASCERPEPRTLVEIYQHELARLRDLAAKYASCHPELAPMVGGHQADPSVERLFEGVAFLNANLQQKLNDDIPEIIDELTEAIHPWDLRPIPATTIVAFTPKADVVETVVIAAGAEVASIPVQGTKCRFKTCYDVTVHPLTLLEASYTQPPGKASCITLQCQLTGISLSDWQPNSLRFFLGDDYPAASDLYLLLMRYVRRIVITSHDSGAAIEMPSECLKAVGLAAEETMLAQEAGLLPGHLLLREYFLFRDKFLFVDLTGLDGLGMLGEGSLFEIDFELKPSPLHVPRIGKSTFVLFATPVINLFPHMARPLIFVKGQEQQAVHPSGDNPAHYRIFSIDEATIYRSEAATETRQAHRIAQPLQVDADNPFHFSRITSPLADSFHARTSVPIQNKMKLDLKLSCTNANLPEVLQIDDICVATATTPESVSFKNIKPILAAVDINNSNNSQWRLLSSFSLDWSCLDMTENLRSILKLFLPSQNRDHSTASADLKGLDWIKSIEAKPTDRLVGGTIYRGYEVRLKLCSDYFTGLGDMYLFATVLDRFLTSYVTQSCSIVLVVDGDSGKHRFQWPAHWGDRHLI